MRNRYLSPKRSIAFLVIPLIVMSASGAGAAPEANDPSLRVMSLDTTAYPAVSATISVPSALNGQTLPDSAFTVRQGAGELATTAEAVPLDRLNVVLAVDPGVDAADLTAVQGGALELIRLVLPSSSMTIVVAGPEPQILLSKSRDDVEAGAVIGQLRVTPTGRGDTLAALSLALDELAPSEPSETMVVLLAASPTGATDVATAVAVKAAATYVPLEVILTGTTRVPTAYAPLADLDSGTVTATAAPEDVVVALDRIFTALSGRYRLQFAVATDPSSPPGVTIGVDADGVVTEREVSVDAPAGSATSVPASTPPPPPATNSSTSAAAEEKGRSSGIGGWIGAGVAVILVSILVAAWLSRDPLRAAMTRRRPARRPLVPAAEVLRTWSPQRVDADPDEPLVPEIVISFRPNRARVEASAPPRAGARLRRWFGHRPRHSPASPGTTAPAHTATPFEPAAEPPPAGPPVAPVPTPTSANVPGVAEQPSTPQRIPATVTVAGLMAHAIGPDFELADVPDAPGPSPELEVAARSRTSARSNTKRLGRERHDDAGEPSKGASEALLGAPEAGPRGPTPVDRSEPTVEVVPVFGPDGQTDIRVDRVTTGERSLEVPIIEEPAARSEPYSSPAELAATDQGPAHDAKTGHGEHHKTSGAVRARPQRSILAADRVERTRPGARWWMYQRPTDNSPDNGEGEPPSPRDPPDSGSSAVATDPPEPPGHPAPPPSADVPEGSGRSRRP